MRLGPARSRQQDRPVRTGSIRLQVALGVFVLLSLVIVTSSLVINAVLADRLKSDLDSRVQERARFAATLVERGLEAQSLADDLTGQGITATVLRDGDATIGRNRPSVFGPPGGPPRTAPAATGSADITTEHRGMTVITTVTSGTTKIVLTADSVEIARTLDTLRTIEIVAGTAILALAGAACLLIVTLATRPLRKMSALAQRIRAGDRGHRLRPTKPGTDVGRTAAAVDAMIDELESAEARAQHAEIRMRDFLADASHDLRTPLAAMVAGAEELLRQDPGRLARENRLVDVIRAGRHASTLVDDLLLLARLDEPASPTTSDPVDLGRLSREVAATARTTHSKHMITLDPATVDQPVGVHGNSDRLRRALTNLVDNACAATPSGGNVRISVDTADANALITITDSGPGVPADAHERIFERFVRLDEARTSGGAGLGLPIARAIVRAHGGDLTSEPAIGGRFTLLLPLARPAEPRPEPLRVPALAVR